MVTKAPLTEAIQDYLKAIYKLQDASGRVTITAVARDQGVSAASASAMLKKLGALGLLDHEPYRGARLTEAGERVAVEVIRHHRLLELYLAETPGPHVDNAHDEADPLANAGSSQLEAGHDPLIDARVVTPFDDALGKAAGRVRDLHGGRVYDTKGAACRRRPSGRAGFAGTSVCVAYLERTQCVGGSRMEPVARIY